MVTGTQMRMARAALHLSTRDLSQHVGVSANAISRYERGDYGVLSAETVVRITAFFSQQDIFFGPAHGVSVGVDSFAPFSSFDALWKENKKLRAMGEGHTSMLKDLIERLEKLKEAK